MNINNDADNLIVLKAKELYGLRPHTKLEVFNKIYHDTLAPLVQVDKYIHDFYMLNEEKERNRINSILIAASFKRADRVLELGCGMGNLVFNIAKETHFCVGVDYSLESLKIAKRINQDFPVSLYGQRYFVCADAANLPFKEGSLDKMVAADFLEHTTKIQKIRFQRELNYVLREGGKFIAHTPNKICSIYKRYTRMFKNLIFNKMTNPEDDFLTASHIGELTPFALKKLCSNMGFCNTRFFYKKNEFYFPFSKRFFDAAPTLQSPFEFVIIKVPFLRDILSGNTLITAVKPKRVIRK